MSRRTERVNELIREELSDLIMRELRDPRLEAARLRRSRMEGAEGQEGQSGSEGECGSAWSARHGEPPAVRRRGGLGYRFFPTAS